VRRDPRAHRVQSVVQVCSSPKAEKHNQNIRISQGNPEWQKQETATKKYNK
jgi:hypothetical protein